MPIKTKTIAVCDWVETTIPQTLILACNEGVMQPAYKNLLSQIGVHQYILRPVFGAVNCLAFNDKKNFTRAIDEIKRFVKYESVNKIIIVCHSHCLADRRVKDSHSLSKSVAFQFEKGRKVKQIILSSLASLCGELFVENYVIVTRGGKHRLKKEAEVRLPKMAKTAVAN